MNIDTRKKIFDILSCPHCINSRLNVETNSLVCKQCGLMGENADRISFEKNAPVESKHDFLGFVKESLKRKFPQLYPKLTSFFSPVYMPNRFDLFLQTFNWEKDYVLDLGCGCSRRHPNIINVDLKPYECVDLVCQIEHLPIMSDSVDGIVSCCVLEHVKDPSAVVKEMLRVLKPGGKIYCYLPFMEGLHGSPDDYFRFTASGIAALFRGCPDIQIEMSAGPMSSFLWIFQEWLAMVLSFGSVKLYWFFYFLFFPIMPIKFLDGLLMKHPMAKNIASGFVVLVKKP